MSIDYDRLRELTRVVENYDDYEPRAVYVAADQLKHVSLDTARELLHLRDGIDAIRDRCATLAKSAQAAGIHTLAREMDINAKALTGLLNGDTE